MDFPTPDIRIGPKPSQSNKNVSKERIETPKKTPICCTRSTIPGSCVNLPSPAYPIPRFHQSSGVPGRLPLYSSVRWPLSSSSSSLPNFVMLNSGTRLDMGRSKPP